MDETRTKANYTTQVDGIDSYDEHQGSSLVHIDSLTYNNSSALNEKNQTKIPNGKKTQKRRTKRKSIKLLVIPPQDKGAAQNPYRLGQTIFRAQSKCRINHVTQENLSPSMSVVDHDQSCNKCSTQVDDENNNENSAWSEDISSLIQQATNTAITLATFQLHPHHHMNQDHYQSEKFRRLRYQRRNSFVIRFPITDQINNWSALSMTDLKDLPAQKAT